MGTASNRYRILLTGPKHVGKTSTGRALALFWESDFIDLDELIEQQTGSSPRTLYTQAPERLKEAETQALASLIKAQATRPQIIAAGGGIIDNEEAMALFNHSDMLIIYLEVSVETAWKRICQGPLPPFLNTDNPQETHKTLHQRRAAAYKSIAHIIIPAEAQEPEHIVQDIIAACSHSLPLCT
ncbi:MAG: shikimate kinase [Treponema sp.]|jgi:shikimate kinase|nr:shikimate kinase [Treponema sp.]